MNLLLTGINTIAALIGYNKFCYYPFNQSDYQNIENLTGIHFDINDNSFENQRNMFDIYTIEGENRYVCLEFDDYYLIYDKALDIIVEEKTSVSPYQLFTDYLCVYHNSPVISIHGYVDEHSIFDLDNNCYLDETLVQSNLDNDAVGEYSLFDEYGSDVVKIENSFYFEELNNQHGYNADGTCGIVAIQILLGYYDTFENDNFIPEEYDIISSQNCSSIPSFNQSPGTGQSFHDDLIHFASERNITNNGVGMTIYQEKDLATQYIESRNIDFDYRWVEGNLSDIASNAASRHIVEAINSGNPVFLGAAGHATVVYGYDSNYIYVHSGWGDVRRTLWETVNTNLAVFWESSHTIEIQPYGIDHLHSDNYYSNTTSKYMCPCGETFSKIVVHPNDYGFDSQYFFTSKQKDVTVSSLSFHTKRLRTGYIEQQFVNLSPRRQNAGTAYLEYTFSTPIRKVAVFLSFWSAYENLSNTDSMLLLQYQDSNGWWFNYYDLLNDVQLSTDRTNQQKYYVNFPNGTMSFRFLATSAAVGNTNKGRLSIGDMDIEYV